MAKPTRKLAAIMFTDIAGYTALAAYDEEKALELIETQRELLKPIVSEFDGDWLKEIGDGLLLSFPSSKHAVNCAIKIQQTVKEIEDLNLRIGIHQGDILEKGGDIFGDDVNIASRIEPFAAVGGVAITRKVQEDISSSPEFTIKYIGQPKLKGVEQQVKVYCITSHGLPETKLADVSAKLERKPTYWLKWTIPTLLIMVAVVYYLIPKEMEVPSVGILYIENLGSEEDEFWARGITEDVIIEVASAGLIRVVPMKEILGFKGSELSLVEIADKLKVKYLLTSSIHKLQGFLNLRVQLLEVKSGKSVYAEKLKEPLSKASTITGTIAGNVINSLGVSTKRDVTKPYTTNPDAYEFYLKGKYKHEKRQNMEDTEVARGLLRKAIEIDSALVKARITLGNTYMETGDYDTALKIYNESLDIAEETENQIDKAGTLRNIGKIYYYHSAYDEALKFYEQSLEISRELSDRSGEGKTLRTIGIIHNYRSDYDEALKFYGQSLEISRELSDRSGEGKILHGIGFVHYNRGNYDEALKYYDQSLEISRELSNRSVEWVTIITIGRVHESRGDYDEAMKLYGQSLEISRELGNRYGEANSLGCFGNIHNSFGDYEIALKYYLQTQEIARELNNLQIESSVFDKIGTVYKSHGDYNNALKLYKQSLKIKRDLGDRAGEGNSMYNFGLAYLEMGEFSKSVEHLQLAIVIFEEIGAKQNIPVTQADLAFAMMKNGNNPQEVLSYAVEAEKDLSVVEEGKIGLLWSLARVYWELGNVKLLNIALKESLWDGLTIEDCRSKYRDFLEQAYREVKEQAQKIQAKKYRESFLTNVRENREVVAAWEKIGN